MGGFVQSAVLSTEYRKVEFRWESDGDEGDRVWIMYSAVIALDSQFTVIGAPWHMLRPHARTLWNALVHEGWDCTHKITG
jgi:hypothetical protein